MNFADEYWECEHCHKLFPDVTDDLIIVNDRGVYCSEQCADSAAEAAQERLDDKFYQEGREYDAWVAWREHKAPRRS